VPVRLLRLRRRRAAALVATALAALAVAIAAAVRGRARAEFAPSRGVVRRVVDGDTLHLTNGAAIRLLEIDAPELDGPLGELARAASEALERLVARREVRLEAGPRVRDVYGRFLAYVLVPAEDGRGAGGSETFANAEIVRMGLARARSWGEPGPRFDEIAQAEREAREARRGIWDRQDR